VTFTKATCCTRVVPVFDHALMVGYPGARAARVAIPRAPADAPYTRLVVDAAAGRPVAYPRFTGSPSFSLADDPTRPA
jgi:hypothetical protein